MPAGMDRNFDDVLQAKGVRQLGRSFRRSLNPAFASSGFKSNLIFFAPLASTNVLSKVKRDLARILSRVSKRMKWKLKNTHTNPTNNNSPAIFFISTTGR